MSIKSKKKLTLDEYISGIKNSDVSILARAITLIESNLPSDFCLAQELLNNILPLTGNSIRIGITGPPGVGKSTFIDKFGYYLCNLDHKVAVLAIDPTSSISKGSILGDKTRMEMLAQHPNSFIRPSPSGGSLGGVARKTRESLLLCEASGFDVIIVETIGVGQSEITVRSMVDFFMLLIPPGGGDELQGFKKGSVEIADVIVVNKADKDNLKLAELTQKEYLQALHYINSATEGWETKVYTASAIENRGIGDLWEVVNNFVRVTKENGVFQKRRNQQYLDWLHSLIYEHLLDIFYKHPKIQQILPTIEKKVFEQQMTPTKAVEIIFKEFDYANLVSDKQPK
ncbi:MAG: methylmalonyl Co-A mutase-associated GTPase MeaB [Candidatus Kapaibacteriales bacterium]